MNLDKPIPLIVEMDFFIKVYGNNFVIRHADYLSVGVEKNEIVFVLGWEVSKRIVLRKFSSIDEIGKEIPKFSELHSLRILPSTNFAFEVLSEVETILDENLHPTLH